MTGAIRARQALLAVALALAVFTAIVDGANKAVAGLTACEWVDALQGDLRLSNTAETVYTDAFLSLGGAGSNEPNSASACSFHPGFKVNLVTDGLGGRSTNFLKGKLEDPRLPDGLKTTLAKLSAGDTLSPDGLHISSIDYDMNDLKANNIKWSKENAPPFTKEGGSQGTDETSYMGWSYTNADQDPAAVEGLRILHVFIVSESKQKGKSYRFDQFEILQQECTEALPLVLFNPDNDRFKCMRLAYQPTTCQDAIVQGSGGHGSAALRFQIGWKQPDQVHEQCDYSDITVFDLEVNDDVFLGSDLEDRLWSALVKPQRGTTVTPSVPVPFSEASLNINRMAMRTSHDHKMMITYQDRLDEDAKDEFGGEVDEVAEKGEQDDVDVVGNQIRQQIKAANMRAAQHYKYSTQPPSGTLTKDVVAANLEAPPDIGLMMDLEQQLQVAAKHRVPSINSSDIGDFGRRLETSEDEPKTILWSPHGNLQCSMGLDGFPQQQLREREGWVNMRLYDADGSPSKRAPPTTVFDGKQMCMRFRLVRRPQQTVTEYRNEQCSMVKDMLRGAMRHREDTTAELAEYGVSIELAEIGRYKRGSKRVSNGGGGANTTEEEASYMPNGFDRSEEVKLLFDEHCKMEAENAEDPVKAAAKCAEEKDKDEPRVWELLSMRDRQQACETKFAKERPDTILPNQGRRSNVFNLIMGEIYSVGHWCGAMTKGVVDLVLDKDSWRWKGDDHGDIALSFSTDRGARQVFESITCKNSAKGKVNWPIIIAADDVTQQYQCIKVYGRSDANCANAIGLSSKVHDKQLDRRMVDFEVSLATQFVNTGETIQCTWMDPFMVHLTNQPHYIDEKLNSAAASSGIEDREACPLLDAKRVIVTGANAPQSDQWRWTTSGSGALTLAFPVISSRDGPFARVWETFTSPTQCPVTSQLASANNFMEQIFLDVDAEAQLRATESMQAEIRKEASFKKKYSTSKEDERFTHVGGVKNGWSTTKKNAEAWEVREEEMVPTRTGGTDSVMADQAGEQLNDEFKCMKIRPIPRADATVIKSADYQQMTLVAKLQDMAEDPAGADSKKGMYQDMVQGMQEYADVKGSLFTALDAEEYSSQVTGEFENQYAALATGIRTFFFKGNELPDGHPNIKTGKMVHADGMVAPCEFVSSHTNPYTGLLSQARVPLIARYSSAVSHDADFFVPGWAFKFFRDAPSPAADVLTYHSFTKQKGCDIFKYAVSNFPTWKAQLHPDTKADASQSSDNIMAGFDHTQQFLLQRGQALKRDSKCPFSQMTNFPYRLGISQLFITAQDALKSMLDYNIRPQKKIPGRETDKSTKVDRCEDVVINQNKEGKALEADVKKCRSSWRHTSWYDGENLMCKTDDENEPQRCIADKDSVHAGQQESNEEDGDEDKKDEEDDDEESSKECLPHLQPRAAVQEASFPDQLVFIPHAAAKSASQDQDLINGCDGRRKEHMIKQLSRIPPRTPLFEVYGRVGVVGTIDLVEYEPMPEEHLGTIYVQQAFFQSWRADTALHFKHEIYASDLQNPSHEMKLQVEDIYTESDKGYLKRSVKKSEPAEDKLQAEYTDITQVQAADMATLSSRDEDLKTARDEAVATEKKRVAADEEEDD